MKMKLAQRIELLHRSSQRMMDSLEIENKDKVWWDFMKKEARMHLWLSIKVWWHIFRSKGKEL